MALANIQTGCQGSLEGTTPKPGRHACWIYCEKSCLLNRRLHTVLQQAKHYDCVTTNWIELKFAVGQSPTGKKLYLDQAQEGSKFDQIFGITIKDGQWIPLNPSSKYNESDFDQRYKPNVYKDK